MSAICHFLPLGSAFLGVTLMETCSLGSKWLLTVEAYILPTGLLEQEKNPRLSQLEQKSRADSHCTSLGQMLIPEPTFVIREL